jgi:hypothetical protein
MTDKDKDGLSAAAHGLDKGAVSAWVWQQEHPETVVPAFEMKRVIPGTSDQFWNSLRHRGGGPVYRKVGRKVYYKLADVYAWLDANAYERTDRPVTTGGDAA